MRHVTISSVLALSITTLGAAAQDYPTKEIQGIIQWGPGGSTDTVMRSVTPRAEEILDGTVVLQNVTGGVGAIALNQVASAPADGYTLLMGAENPLIYRVMGLGERDYSDFIPINILARGTPILVAGADAPFDDYAGMMDYIEENPGEVRFGSTGPGGLPSVITSMIEEVEDGLDVTSVPYDGDGPALTALQGGAIDVMPAVLGAAIEAIRGGNIKPLAVFTEEPVDAVPDVEPVTSFEEGYAQYLPWGPFFGVFVREGTPENAVEALRDAYGEAASTEEFSTLMENRAYSVMNITGEEAETFLSDWQSTTAWLLQEAGLARTSPEELGIPRPGE